MPRQDVLKMKKGFLQSTKYLNESLSPDEKALYRAHISWIPIFINQLPFILIGGLVGGIVWGVTVNFLLGAAVFAAAWVIGILCQIPAIYRAVSTDILLTTQGLHTKEKLVAVENDQFTRYAYLNDAELNYHSVFQRIFEYGDITIPTIGAGGGYEFRSVAKPKTLKAAVRLAQQQYGTSSGLPMQPQAAPQQTAMAPQQNTRRRARKLD